MSSSGETSTEVAKHPSIETSKGAKRPGHKTSTWRTGKVAKRPVTVLSCTVTEILSVTVKCGLRVVRGH